MARFAREPEAGYRAAFGWRLRELRLNADVSQERLANSATVSRRYLSGLERGENNPTLDTIVRLARVLAVEPSQLLPDTPPAVKTRRRTESKK